MVRREENQIDTLKKLLLLLSDGEFHSGAELGRQLNLTRAAIWKLIQQLKALDIELESITAIGYRIPKGLSLLDKNKILSYLSELNSLKPLKTQVKTNISYPAIEILDSIGSTNDYLMAKAREIKTPLCCVAEKQTKGKGRLGRTWDSPFATNIYCSLLWQFNCDVSELSGLSLVAAITVAKVLQNLGVTEHLGLKWPNDVLWQQLKLGGILLEISGETQSSSQAVIGIGINVAMPEKIGAEISQPWVDLNQILGKAVDRNLLVAHLIHELSQSLNKFQQQGFTAFMTDWQALDLCFGKTVRLIRANDIVSGIGRGVDERGQFLLEDAAGNLKTYTSGEVSLRFGARSVDLTPSLLE